MKNKLQLLGLSIITLCLVGCMESNAVKNATQEYVKANGDSMFGLALLGALGGNDLHATIEISQWSNTPIDTITRGEFYKYELRTRIKKANEYKLNILHEDSIQVAKNRKEMKSSRSETWRELYKDWLRESTLTLKKHQKEYKNQVDQITRLKELAAQPNQDEILFLVYQCTEKISFKHPISGEQVQKERNCFSYSDQIQHAIVYVDEGTNDYVPKYDKLHSPYNEIDSENDEEELL